jgi:hypothetical protein
MKKEKPKPIPSRCLVCDATPVAPDPEGVDADYALCLGHLATLHDTPAQRTTLLHIRQDLVLRRVAVSVDANGVGWFHRLPPESPKPRPPIILDDGSLRYRDWDPKAIIGDDDNGGE